MNIIINNESLEIFISSYTLLKKIYIVILFFIIIYIDNINKLFVISLFQLAIIYLLPLIFFSIIIINEVIIKFIKYINDKTKNKEIKILELINQ